MNNTSNTQSYGMWIRNCGGPHPTVSPRVTDEMRLPKQDLLGEKRLANLSEEKSPEHLFPWAFIEFSLHRNTYQRKEVWFTDNISGITRGLLSQGLVDRVTAISHKT